MSKEIIKLISECAKSGVKSLKVSGENCFEVEFFDSREVVEDVRATYPETDLSISNEFKVQEVAEKIDQDYDDLILSDPARYEKALLEDKLIEFGEEEYAESITQ